uniref:Uncharacterized protein n=1 Tax=Glossina brevipalpis TaxID=37001 RepID=A0A1A9WV54_9MUSC
MRHKQAKHPKLTSNLEYENKKPYEGIKEPNNEKKKQRSPHLSSIIAQTDVAEAFMPFLSVLMPIFMVGLGTVFAL